MTDSRRIVDSDERTYRYAALGATAEREAHRQTGGGSPAPSRLQARSPLTSRASFPDRDGDDARGLYSREAHLTSSASPAWRAREGDTAFARRPDPDARRARTGPDYRAGAEAAGLARKLADAAEKYREAGSLRPDELMSRAIGKVLADLKAAREKFGRGRGGGYGGGGLDGPSGGGGGGFDLVQLNDLLNPGGKSRGLPDGKNNGPDISGGSGWGGSSWGDAQGSLSGPATGGGPAGKFGQDSPDSWGRNAPFNRTKGFDLTRSDVAHGDRNPPPSVSGEAWVELGELVDQYLANLAEAQDIKDSRKSDDEKREIMEKAIEDAYTEASGGDKKTAEELEAEARRRQQEQEEQEEQEEEEKKKKAVSSNPNPEDPDGGPVGPWVRSSRAERQGRHARIAMPDPDAPGGGGPVGPWSRRADRPASSSLGRQRAIPNPEDPGGGGPVGPWSHEARSGGRNIFDRIGKPNPDDPHGPVGPALRRRDG